MWLNSTAKIEVDRKTGRIVANVQYDLAAYYLWFVTREYKVKPFPGRYSPHVSLVLPKFHKDIDWAKAQKFHGRIVRFSYNIKMEEGGKKSAGKWISFWFHVLSKDMEDIMDVLNIKNNRHLHLTLGNTKQGTIPWNGYSHTIK